MAIFENFLEVWGIVGIFVGKWWEIGDFGYFGLFNWGFPLEKVKNAEIFEFKRRMSLDSNNFSIGIHFFKVLVQIHYSLLLER